MSIKKVMIVFLLLIIFSLHSIYAQPQSEKQLIDHCINATQKLLGIQKIVWDIHPFLNNFYPIAIVENNHYYIFNYDSTKNSYVFFQEATHNYWYYF